MADLVESFVRRLGAHANLLWLCCFKPRPCSLAEQRRSCLVVAADGGRREGVDVAADGESSSISAGAAECA
jgi:hypothetical protein